MGNITVVFKNPLELEHEGEVEVELDEETTLKVRAFARATSRTEQQVIELAMVELPNIIREAMEMMTPEQRERFANRRAELMGRRPPEARQL